MFSFKSKYCCKHIIYVVVVDLNIVVHIHVYGIPLNIIEHVLVYCVPKYG